MIKLFNMLFFPTYLYEKYGERTGLELAADF